MSRVDVLVAITDHKELSPMSLFPGGLLPFLRKLDGEIGR